MNSTIQTDELPIQQSNTNKHVNRMEHKKKGSMGRNWIGTYFSDNLDKGIEQLRMHCLYFMAQVELCPTTNREHLQFFAHFNCNARISKLQKILPGGHFEIASNSTACIRYCSKENTRIRGPYTEGIAPQDKQKLGTKLSVKQSAELTEEELQDLNPYNYILTKKALAIRPLEPTISDTVRGLWIHGPPGCGKSLYVRENFESIYLKGQNKWFCGYNGEQTILLDDLDVAKGSKESLELGHMLKIVTDHYACSGEIKGGRVSLQHKIFIITSNYLPEDIWIERNMLLAIRRRFKFKDMSIDK